MNSHERMLGILDLFEEDDRSVALSFEALHARLGYPRSTLYRYLKALTDAGLLSSLPGMGYVLGSRIIELDYKIRSGDPLIRAARPVMQELVGQFTAIALLCRRYRHQVLCVHQESTAETLRSTYERGKVRPLLRGAASMIILACLPPHALRRLHAQMPEAFAAAGLGATLPEVRLALKPHRQRGWMMTAGDLTPGVTGIAAPLFDAREEVLGSLSLTVPQSGATPAAVERMAGQLVLCAGIISKAMTQDAG